MEMKEKKEYLKEKGYTENELFRMSGWTIKSVYRKEKKKEKDSSD